MIFAYLLMSSIAFIAIGYDKSAAVRRGQRIPEKTLLLLTLLGGWPGAVLAYRFFRHKTQKQPFKTHSALMITLNCLFMLVWVMATWR